MSDYASVITEPFWRRDLPEVHAFFVAEGWTEIAGDKGSVAFANVACDLSEQGISASVWFAPTQIEPLLPEGRDFWISLIFDGGRRESKGAKQAREEADFLHDAYASDGAKMKAMEERAERDRRENEGMDNPDLDAFLGEES